MTARALLTCLLAATLAAPLAFADHQAPCAAVTDAGATPLALPSGTLYVGSDGGVYEEGNNVPGLQTAGCSDDNGREFAADGRLL